ncbi:lysophospholipid acyltransferase family protein [Sphingobacterium suaedae]|uniref:Lysophospholipid acyltransferase family protein n=1 Tax=Sphingobacterium suaedae TaxID=1686402 RepID=A0ABW5KDL8_9SPHI
MLGYFIGQVYKYRLSVCIQNLSRAFPSFSYQEISEQSRRFYTNFGRILWEGMFPRFVKLRISETTSDVLQGTVQKEQPIVLLLGHYGNWEILSKLPQHTSIPVQALYKPLKNKILNRFLYRKRSQYGVRLLPAGQALRILMKEKQRASITFFIADQFPGHNRGLTVHFLHQATRMFVGAEQLAKRLNAYVGYVELQRTGKNVWTLDIKPICEYAGKTANGYVTETFAHMLEESIQKDPSWWLWTHRRWK